MLQSMLEKSQLDMTYEWLEFQSKRINQAPQLFLFKYNTVKCINPRISYLKNIFIATREHNFNRSSS